MSAGWVCPECGLDYDTISGPDTVVAVRSYPRRYRALLTSLDEGDDPDALIRRRPSPTTWSALEYTAHVADVMESIAGDIRRMLVEDAPHLDMGFDADERVAERAYNQQDREQVLQRLERECVSLASVLDGIDPDAWRRLGHFPYGERDVLAIARNAVHEGAHHLRDVEKGLQAVR